MRKPNFSLFGLRFVTDYIPGIYAQRVLEGPATHPRAYAVKDIYRSRPKVGLWKAFVTNTEIHRRVVRSKVSRKMRTAFADAMRQQGYSDDGFALDPKGTALTGSVHFFSPDFFKVLNDGELLKKDMENAVQWIIRAQKIGPTSHAVRIAKRDKNGRSTNEISSGAVPESIPRPVPMAKLSQEERRKAWEEDMIKQGKTELVEMSRRLDAARERKKADRKNRQRGRKHEETGSEEILEQECLSRPAKA